MPSYWIDRHNIRTPAICPRIHLKERKNERQRKNDAAQSSTYDPSPQVAKGSILLGQHNDPTIIMDERAVLVYLTRQSLHNCSLCVTIIDFGGPGEHCWHQSLNGLNGVYITGFFCVRNNDSVPGGVHNLGRSVLYTKSCSSECCYFSCISYLTILYCTVVRNSFVGCGRKCDEFLGVHLKTKRSLH